MKDLPDNVLQNLQVQKILPLMQNTSEAIVSNKLSYFSLSALSKKLGHLSSSLTPKTRSFPMTIYCTA